MTIVRTDLTLAKLSIGFLLCLLGSAQEREARLRVQLGHLHGVSAAFSPNGRQIITTSWDSTARLWDAATGREIKRFHGDFGLVRFSQDGRAVLASADEQSVWPWDSGTGKEIWRLKPEFGVLFYVFSPGWRWIVNLQSECPRRFISLWIGTTTKVRLAVVPLSNGC